MDNKNNKIINWLINRGLSPAVILNAGIKWNGRKIVIPIKDKDDNIIFNKYRKDPFCPNDEDPKYIYDTGSKATIYGINLIKNFREDIIIICEGELDALLLISNNLPAVCSTGGAGTFKREWFEDFDVFKKRKIYICFDNDDAGRMGINRIAEMREVNVIPLPDTLGKGGDITDYVKLYGIESFKNLIDYAFPYKIKKEEKRIIEKNSDSNIDLIRAKGKPITDYIKTKKNGKYFITNCPFHPDSNASFTIFEDNKFRCFGCGENGDVIDFIMKRNSLSFKQALNFLLNKSNE